MGKNLLLLITTSILFATVFECQSLAQSRKIDVSKFSSFQVDSLSSLILLKQNIKNSDIDLLTDLYRKSLKINAPRYDILDTVIFLSKKADYKSGLARAYDRKGLNYRYQTDYLKSLEFHKKALSIYGHTKDTLGKMICLNNLGVVLRKINNEAEAMRYYITALNLAEITNNERNIAISSNGIGNVHLNMEDYPNAMKYFRKALEIEYKHNNKRGINYDLANIAETFMKLNELDSSLAYYKLALDIGEKRMYKSDISIDYYNMGMVYLKMDSIRKAEEFFLMSIPRLEKYQSDRYLSKVYIELGETKIKQKEYKLAEKYIEKGLKMAEEAHTYETLIEGYELFSEFYEETKNPIKALKYFKDGTIIRDSIMSAKNRQNIAAMEIIYENRIKDQEIEKYQYELMFLKTRKKIHFLIILFLVLISFALIINTRLKKKNNTLLINEMRNDIQTYVNRLEELELQQKPMNEEDERQILKITLKNLVYLKEKLTYSFLYHKDLKMKKSLRSFLFR